MSRPCARPLKAEQRPWFSPAICVGLAAVLEWRDGGPLNRKPTPIPVLVPGVSDAAIKSDK